MRVEELERELRAERPAPDPEFARRLDEWAAAGFPRDHGLGPRAGAHRHGVVAGLRARISALPPRRVLAPVGALATLLVVVGVVVGQRGPSTTISDDFPPANSNAEKPAPQAANEDEAASSAVGRSTQAEALGEDVATLPVPASDGDRIARGTDERIVDATARITLGAEVDRIQAVANDVVAVTDRHDGIVLSSQVTTDAGGARAAFELEIPYKQLDAALTDLSGLADVISRTEAGQDITARAVRAQKDLAATYERIRRARIELIRADTTEERLVIESRIRSLEATADAQRAELNGVERQGRFATVNVDVTSSGSGSGEDGGWSLGEALDDAGRVLEVIGGIALVGLAVLVPVAAVGALAWLIATRIRRRRRERALDAQA
jgi:hypothetical protein